LKELRENISSSTGLSNAKFQTPKRSSEKYDHHSLMSKSSLCELTVSLEKSI